MLNAFPVKSNIYVHMQALSWPKTKYMLSTMSFFYKQFLNAKRSLSFYMLFFFLMIALFQRLCFSFTDKNVYGGESNETIYFNLYICTTLKRTAVIRT